MAKAFAIVAGVGPGTGASVAKLFARSYAVVLLARKPESYNSLVNEINGSGGNAIGISTDVQDRDSVRSAFGQIKKEFNSTGLAAAIYNVGAGFIRKPFLELSPDEFESGFKSNTLGAFNFSQAVLPLLLEAKGQLSYPPTLIFTGATASVKANAMMSPFATGKHSLRALSHSLAKEFAPQGIHVAHAIIDGVIDIPRTKNLPGFDKPDSKISPDSIAAEYWHLHTQPRNCFTNEIDIRPWVEKW